MGSFLGPFWGPSPHSADQNPFGGAFPPLGVPFRSFPPPPSSQLPVLGPFLAVLGPVEAAPEYRVIVDANNLTVEIENELSEWGGIWGGGGFGVSPPISEGLWGPPSIPMQLWGLPPPSLLRPFKVFFPPPPFPSVVGFPPIPGGLCSPPPQFLGGLFAPPPPLLTSEGLWGSPPLSAGLWCPPPPPIPGGLWGPPPQFLTAFGVPAIAEWFSSPPPQFWGGFWFPPPPVSEEF